ncbi:MAG: hypothetical protein GY924_20105 [Planctomycetaceae bacterium]|nr:hypothetical protein [Planctomycetaceae bacterium]
MIESHHVIGVLQSPVAKVFCSSVAMVDGQNGRSLYMFSFRDIGTRLFGFIVILLLIDVCLVSAQDHWLAGTGRSAITPKEPLMMAGYASRTTPAKQKNMDLWAKVLFLEDRDGSRGVLISLDLVGIGRALSQRVCQRLKDSFGMERDQIAIFTSHTHSGPVVGQNLAPMHFMLADPVQQKRIRAYADRLVDEIESAVGMAIKESRPSRIQWGSGQSTFAVNRRENKPYDTVDEKRAMGTLVGPVDHDVPVLSVRDLSGKLFAIMFGYACHATTLASAQWDGDYPGYAQADLEKSYPGCTAMFWAGCGADQNPLPRRKLELAQKYGAELASAVKDVIASPMTVVEPELGSKYVETALEMQGVPDQKQLDQTVKSTNRYEASRAKMLQAQMLKQGQISNTYPYPIAVWKLGSDIEFVHLGGEVVVDYALRLKDELSGTRTWVAGYANDVMAYIPSRRVLAEGGYEGGGSNVYYGLPGLWHPESEAKIIDVVRDHHEKMNETKP